MTESAPGDIFVSLTRLRLRSARFLPGFFIHAARSQRQLKRSSGFLGGELLADAERTFWTMTAWSSREDAVRYMTTGAHGAAMPKLLHWCDEASVAHWRQPHPGLPDWPEADRRMRSEGRISKVLRPSPLHAGLRYRPPERRPAVKLLPPGEQLRRCTAQKQRRWICRGLQGAQRCRR